MLHILVVEMDTKCVNRCLHSYVEWSSNSVCNTVCD